MGCLCSEKDPGIMGDLCGTKAYCHQGPDCSLSTLICVPEGPAESLGVFPSCAPGDW